MGRWVVEYVFGWEAQRVRGLSLEAVEQLMLGSKDLSMLYAVYERLFRCSRCY